MLHGLSVALRGRSSTSRSRSGKGTSSPTFSQHIADTDTAAQVLLDAITRAGSLDPNAINNQIAKTDKTYVVGHIKFGPDHTSTLRMVEERWHNGKSMASPRSTGQPPRCSSPPVAGKPARAAPGAALGVAGLRVAAPEGALAQRALVVHQQPGLAPPGLA